MDENEKGKSKANSRRVVTFSFVLTGIFTVCAVVGLFFIFHDDGKSGSFDDLLSTGGSVRKRSIVEEPGMVGEIDEAKRSKIKTNSEKKTYAKVTKKSGDFSKAVHKNNYKTLECNSKRCHQLTKYIKNSMNTSIDPCHNFYEYACGGWMKRNPIPKTSSTFSTFSKLNQKVEQILHKILGSSMKKDPITLKKAKKFYRSCMAMNKINKRGKKPIMELVKYLGSWSIASDNSWKKDKWNLLDILVKIQQEFTSSGGPLLSVHVSDDPVHSERHILEVDQAGPSLPREIYFDRPKALRAYEEYMIDVAKLLGAKGDLVKQANETVAFEKKLAEISVRDDEKTDSWFHTMTLGELEKEVPDFPWFDYLNKVFENRTKIGRTEKVVVPAISYLKKMMPLVNSTSKETLSNYIVWSVIQDEVPYLSKPFLKTRMRYKEKILGSKGLRKRWKTCVSYTNEYLGELLGKLYVEDNFSVKSKVQFEGMIRNIRSAFKNNVRGLKWMDTKTQDRVMDKADAMRDQVGFPSYINNITRFEVKYQNLSISASDLFLNRLSMIRFAHNRMLNKLRKEVDKNEWPMDPQTINAMYSFNQNGMIIPAGILQPPFFHGHDSSVAMTYGAIGAILGHELTHGFDNTGRKFNKHGELRKQWWTNSSLEHFKIKSKCMEDQYGNYKVRGKYKINGKLTLGENIADNGGFKTSLKAYHNWVSKKGYDMILPNLKFTNDQLFHLAFAQAYCSNSRPNEQYLATLNDRHSEEEFRVIGTLSNSAEFADAFKCKLGSKMNPVKKCQVWTDDNDYIGTRTTQ